MIGIAMFGIATSGVAACKRPEPSGQQLAEQHCQSCHMLPAPALLDRATWEHWVLPRMARRLGLNDVGDPLAAEPIERGEAERVIREAQVFPDTPQLSHAEWERLAAYYALASPPSPPSVTAPAVETGIPGFRVRVPSYHVASPMVTLVHVDTLRHRIYVGDATPDGSTLAVLDGAGRKVSTFPLTSPVSGLHLRGDTLAVLFMGQLHPSDVPRGAVALVSAWRAGAAPTIAWQVDSLYRPVFASYADLNGDGVEDVVVSEFGNLTGRLAWYERRPGGGSRRHVLIGQPGALTTFVRDVDGDGRLDVLALTAQGDEGITLFRGQPNGTFVAERLLRFPPSYGSTSMDLVDVNGDGHPDIVYANGDAGDFPGPTKPYQGVRIFLNDGRGHFAERYFFAFPGAFKVIARDFDGDGDVDIAAISFYPDYASGTPVPFVYLENVGSLKFRARTFPEAVRGRWLTMDAGDIDGDGDVDLVLGSFAQLNAQGDIREASAPWRQPDTPTLVILENTTAQTAQRPRLPPSRH